MAARKKPGVPAVAIYAVIATIVIPIITFFVGMVVNGYTFTANLATKPYVDEGLANTRKYADERAMQALEKAIAHSDMNRMSIMVELKQYGAEQRANGAKIDSLIDSVRELHRVEKPRK